MPAETILYLTRSNGGRMPVHLLHADRKSLAISVYPDLRVEAVAPMGADVERVREKLKKRLPWILRQRWYFEGLLPHAPPRRHVAGETHCYLGRQYRLKLHQGEERGVKLNGRFLEVTTPEPKDATVVRRQLEGWYQERAKAYFERKLGELFERLRGRDIPPPRLTVRRMKTRWGSCTSDGHILLNPDLIQTPSHCVEYVIVHELCHLVHPNHGAGFKRLLVNLLPDWEKRKRRLAEFRG
ncbi:MAG: M48 family metallopeptidase [Verrucomicrobiae bacterium]|nr:M48 family metallopeptidase [Verrucomicrobiae bacterium]